MSKPTAIDVHGFGGGFTLGTAQAGFDIVAKKGREVGFGVLNVLANRHLIPGDWEVESGDPAMWVPQPANFVFGNPPCSGFSTLSPKHFRGEDSSINDCMWELVRYAAKVAPEVVAFESVQQAFTQGRGLMRALHAELCETTGHKYELIHVLHNNASVGGASVRRRYFWVAARVPFGVESNATYWDFRANKLVQHELSYVPSFNDILCDLKPLSLTIERQPYRGTMHDQCTTYCDDWRCEVECHEVHNTKTRRSHQPEQCPSHWVDVMKSSDWNRVHMHDGTGTVDGHEIAQSPTLDRIREMIELSAADGEPWLGGESMSDVVRRYWARHGGLPVSWQYMSRKQKEPLELNDKGKPVMVPIRKDLRLKETDFAMGHNQPTRWRGERMARVITGGVVHLIVHPTEPRTLSQREAARIQGFPDAWHIWPVRFAKDLGSGWGKGVPVHAGRWIADWARRSIEGQPGSMQGKRDEHGELIIDITNDYKPFAQLIGDFG